MTFVEIGIACTALIAAYVATVVYTPTKEYAIAKKLQHCIIGHRAAPVVQDKKKSSTKNDEDNVVVAPSESKNDIIAAPKTDDHTKGVHDENGFIIPENTLSSFQLALKSGVRTVELDVQLTKDNIPVVFHDTVIGFTLDVNGEEEKKKLKICELTFAELNSMQFLTTLDCNNQQGKSPYTKERVTPLEDVLKFCKTNNMNIMIEIKPQANLKKCCQLIVEQVKKTEMFDNIYVASFSPVALFWVRWYAAQKICTGFLFTPTATTNLKLEFARQNIPTPAPLKSGLLCAAIDGFLRLLGHPVVLRLFGHSIVVPQFTYLSRYVVENYRNWGLTVLTWTANEVVEQDYLFKSLGVTVITDHPRLELIQQGTDI